MGYWKFTFRFTILYTVTYVIFGLLYYQYITYQYYEEGGAFAGFLVSSTNEVEWNQVQSWMIPTQILRSILLSSVLFPIWKKIEEFSFSQLFLFLWGYLGIASGLASDIPAPGNLEGLLYMNKAITWKIHGEILSEILLHSGVFSFIFCKWNRR